jgi:hypothetical protein
MTHENLIGAAINRTLAPEPATPTPTPAAAEEHRPLPTGVAFNPRYVAYARMHGHTPDEQLAIDDKTWPGGRMAGFILWINERWLEWGRLTGVSREFHWDCCHGSFDAWILDGCKTPPVHVEAH